VEALYQGKQRELNVLTQLTTVKQQIKETSDENNETIKNLTNNNRKLMANRMQPDLQTSCNSGGVSEAPGTANGSNGTNVTTGWRISEASGEAIITDYEYADQLNESLRACRTYVNSLKEILK
jgi:hypothetical protein